LRRPRDTLNRQKLALTSPESCGRLVGIVRMRTKTTKFSFHYATIYAPGFPLAYFLQVFLSESYIHFSSLPCVLHATPYHPHKIIRIISGEENCEAAHYAVFPSLSVPTSIRSVLQSTSIRVMLLGHPTFRLYTITNTPKWLAQR
jgi:hypothetical protein